MNMPVFNVNGTELYYIVKNHYRMQWNRLSPFMGQPEGGNAPSEEALKLAQDPDFYAVVYVLAQPHLKLSFLKGGAASPLESFSAYFSRDSAGGTIGVSLHDDNGELVIVYFRNTDEYAQFFVAQNGSLVSASPVNLVKPRLGLETLIATLNLTDCYRRAYLNNLLSDSTEPVKAILEAEYLEILDREIKSRDIRWLLPSFIRLIPGIGNAVLDFKAELVDDLKSLGFLTALAKDEAGSRIYMLGASAEYMGMEFTHFWKSSTGFEAKMLQGADAVVCKGRYYLAPTDEANHIITVYEPSDASKGNWQAEHRALSAQDLISFIKQITG